MVEPVKLEFQRCLSLQIFRSFGVLKISLVNANGNFKMVVASNMSLVVRKPVFCICKNKDADQLRCNREADQRLFFAT